MADSPYIELRARSAFSFLEGGSPPEDLVDTAANLNLPAVALLDRDGLYGAPRFHFAARKAGLRAHIGAEITCTDDDMIGFGWGNVAKQYDEIGFWSELKLSIIRDYATEYSKILANQPGFRHAYIDGFAGPGVHLSKRTAEFVPGSPLNAMEIIPPFKEFHFIDADEDRTAQLKALANDRPDVHAYAGDCNDILPRDVFPRFSYEKRQRALCLLDPYNIDLAWTVVETAGKMRSIEIFLNFMIMDANMNAVRRDPDSADPRQVNA